MAALITDSIDKATDGLSPVLGVVERKLHVKRSIIIFVLLGIFSIYMIFGWGNDFICNFIGILYPIFASLLALKSPGTQESKRLLIYWIVYSTLTCVEYFGDNLFNAFLICIELFVHSLYYLSYFYWLAKCLFFLWFINTGAGMISRIFSGESSDSQDQANTDWNVSSPSDELTEETIIERMYGSSTLTLQWKELNEKNTSVVIDVLRKVEVTTLQLEYDQMKSAQMQQLADALRDNTTVTSLQISGNDLGDEGAQYVADLLRTNTTITNVALGANTIGPQGVQYLADALRINTTLTTLNLRENSTIGNEGAQYLADGIRDNTTLVAICLTSCGIETKGAEYLADALRNKTSLKTLEIGNNEIGPEGVKQVVQALQSVPTLTELDLGMTKMEDEGVTYLAGLFRNNTTLTTIDLGQNEIGPEGIRYLVDALRGNTSLTTLKLFGNKIGDEGIQLLADGLKNNTTLTEINVMLNEIGEAGQKAIETLKEKPGLMVWN